MKYIFFIAALLGIPCVLHAQKITAEDVKSAEKMFDLDFGDAKIDSLLGDVESKIKLYATMHRQTLGNGVPLSTVFSPVLPFMEMETKQKPVHFAVPKQTGLPENLSDLAFYSIPQLAALIQQKKISSVELTRFFMDRLKKYGDTLQCVVELTEEIAMQEAAEADRELAAGRYRGILHGIPYGLKDLFAVPGTRTTWGAEPYKEQRIEENSYVYLALKNAGAVLVAKLSLGALAMGDEWYGGKTKSPWNLSRGSSGSSAGSAAATAAGLVPFAIGTETYGSIISPSAACGTTGLRPTFGSISRTGAMSLSWTLDKVGPLTRSAEDAAIVFHYVHGNERGLLKKMNAETKMSIPLNADASAVDMPFNYEPDIDLSKLRIGYAKNYISDGAAGQNERDVLDVFKKAGATLIPMVFPDSAYRFGIIGLVIGAESSAAFDGFTRNGQDDLMTHQRKGDWPNYFRASRFIPAAEYLNANRHRLILMQEINKLFEDFDVIITPTWGGSQVAITNLTGHPAVIFPTGFGAGNMPKTITLLGRLYDEATLLAVAKKYQDLTEWNKRKPEFFK